MEPPRGRRYAKEEKGRKKEKKAKKAYRLGRS
jgi:hypothetical protein